MHISNVIFIFNLFFFELWLYFPFKSEAVEEVLLSDEHKGVILCIREFISDRASQESIMDSYVAGHI